MQVVFAVCLLLLLTSSISPDTAVFAYGVTLRVDNGDVHNTHYATTDPPFIIRRLTPREGLAHHTVSAIVQDEHGFMWFGTAGGLDRYDGYEFRHFKFDPSRADGLC